MNRATVNTELTSKSTLRDATFGIASAYLSHVVFGQPSTVDSLTTRPEFGLCGEFGDSLGKEVGVGGPVWSATLGVHVSDVVALGAKKEVVWIDAVANVAAVANQHPGWDGSNEVLVGPTVCANLSAVMEESVTVIGKRTCPEPAAIRAGGLVNLGHESGKGIAYDGHVMTSLEGYGRASGCYSSAGALCCPSIIPHLEGFMANQVQVKRPDGKVLTVSRKHFERSLKGKGYTEVKDAPKKPTARKDEGK